MQTPQIFLTILSVILQAWFIVNYPLSRFYHLYMQSRGFQMLITIIFGNTTAVYHSEILYVLNPPKKSCRVYMQNSFYCTYYLFYTYYVIKDN